jgi:hypothetical protein
MRLEPKDRRDLARFPQSHAHVGEQILEPSRRICVAEKELRFQILVGSCALDYLGEVCREIRFGDVTSDNVPA